MSSKTRLRTEDRRHFCSRPVRYTFERSAVCGLQSAERGRSDGTDASFTSVRGEANDRDWDIYGTSQILKRMEITTTYRYVVGPLPQLEAQLESTSREGDAS